jgi:hypothetical protein
MSCYCWEEQREGASCGSRGQGAKGRVGRKRIFVLQIFGVVCTTKFSGFEEKCAKI